MKKQKGRSVIAALLAGAVLMISGCGGDSKKESVSSADTKETADSTAAATESKPSEPDKNELTALEVTKLMGNGINLGNTMEAYNHKAYLSGSDPVSAQTLWGMPVTTQDMINGMKAAGFDTLRVPIAWTNGINYEDEEYVIDERLMNRVDEIVNYALNADMYVIINDHWDGSWWGMFGSASEETRVKAMDLYKTMWHQIAKHFADYSYKLVFESANEELGDRLNDKDIAEDSGTLSKDQCFETTNMINSEFVKLVRSTGGKNADRFLLIAGYNTDIVNTCDDRYKMPEDTADSKLIVSVHFYTPWDYCGTKAVNNWGSPKQYEEMNSMLKKLTKFTDAGYGVIIGEYGVLTDGSPEPKPDSDLWFTNFLNNCDLYNYCPLLWDCNGLFRRNEGVIQDKMIAGIFSSRCYAEESKLSETEVRANAQKGIEDALKAADERMSDPDDIPATDDTAVAWIMYQSSDFNAAYSVGDVYDPTNKSVGIKAKNALIEGAGQYTISLDFSAMGGAKGVNFSAIGIYNGEKLFPDYTITINSFKIDGEEYELTGKPYTSSDDGKCTRVNLNNPYINTVPDDARTADGDRADLSAQVFKINRVFKTIEITFTYAAP